MSPNPRKKPPQTVRVQEVLDLVAQIMRRQKKTQLEIQEKLGWGRSYISQLMTSQKSLRLDQLFTLLDALEVRPPVFFAELYGLEPPAEVARLEEVVDLAQRIQDLSQGLDKVSLRIDHLEKAGQEESGRGEAPPESHGESLRFPRILRR